MASDNDRALIDRFRTDDGLSIRWDQVGQYTGLGLLYAAVWGIIEIILTASERLYGALSQVAAVPGRVLSSVSPGSAFTQAFASATAALDGLPSSLSFVVALVVVFATVYTAVQVAGVLD